jgi:two-component system sensor histidine kinase YesM
VNELVNFNLVQVSKNIDASLTSYEDLLFQVFSDENIIDLVEKINTDPEGSKAIEKNQLKDRLAILTYSKDGIRSISVFCSNGVVVCHDRKTGSLIVNEWSGYQDIRKLNIYKNAVSNKSVILSTEDYNPLDKNKEDYVFHLAGNMSDFNKLWSKSIGVVVISIDDSVLSNACNQFNSNRQSFNLSSFNFIVDAAGNIISFPDKRLIGTNVNAGTKAKNNTELKAKYTDLINKTSIFKDKHTIINTYTDRTSGWTVVNATDQNYLFNEMYSMQRLSIIYGFAIIILSLALIITISNSIGKSIGKIVGAMKVAQKGELNVQVDIDTKDEISIIGSSFNKMMVKVNQLVEDVTTATQRKKEAEIRALEAQINPHFLYNTLDAINWMAIEKEEYEISKMLKSLAMILRYSINKSNKFVTIREELEWLNQYIYLQQYRFDNSFHCEVHADETVLDCRIYKLLLQPFIENSIIHGFAGYKGEGLIKINIGNFEEEYVRFIIEDNGVGISEDKLEILNRDDTNDAEQQGSGIGIKNVFNRIKICYGDKATCHLTSTVEKGTTACVIIPKSVNGGMV